MVCCAVGSACVSTALWSKKSSGSPRPRGANKVSMPVVMFGAAMASVILSMILKPPLTISSSGVNFGDVKSVPSVNSLVKGLNF